MIDDLVVQFILVFLAIFAVWLFLGYRNYNSYYKKILAYEKDYIYFESMEESTTLMYKKTDFYLKKHELQKDFPEVHHFYMELSQQENRQKYLNKTKLQFLLLGPVYNLF